MRCYAALWAGESLPACRSAPSRTLSAEEGRCPGRALRARGSCFVDPQQGRAEECWRGHAAGYSGLAARLCSAPVGVAGRDSQVAAGLPSRVAGISGFWGSPGSATQCVKSPHRPVGLHVGRCREPTTLMSRVQTGMPGYRPGGRTLRDHPIAAVTGLPPALSTGLPAGGGASFAAVAMGGATSHWGWGQSYVGGVLS